MSLHWYCPENGLTFLRHGKLAFRSLSQLGDPLLQNKHVKPIDPGAPITEAELSQELQKQYQALPSHLSNIVSFEYFQQQALAKRVEIEAQLLQRRVPMAAYLTEGQVDAIALLQLYSSPDSLSLWESKANQHKGLMFTLKSHVPDFKTPKYKDKPQRFGAVKYELHRPMLKPSAPLEPLFSRPSCFSTEQESRVVRLKSAADKHVKLHGVDWYLYKLPLAQVVSVTFGCLMSEAERNKMVSIMRADLRYRHITLHQCLLDPLQFKLIQEPIQ